MTLIPALEGLRQENFVVEDSLGYIEILCLKKKLTKLHAHLEKLCTYIYKHVHVCVNIYIYIYLLTAVV